MRHSHRWVALAVGALTIAAGFVTSPAVLAAPSGATVMVACSAPAWAEGTSYAAGAQVTYNGRLYRARVAELVSTRRALARIEDGRVVFKAEIGSATSQACQVQGVWVDPAHRGSGLGTIGTAAVACAVARSGRLPSLYVNSFNAPARGAYARAGFRQVATFSTVLLD